MKHLVGIGIYKNQMRGAKQKDILSILARKINDKQKKNQQNQGYGRGS
ncbi:hypothetical protein [Helicobacter fennelliae]|nr:hypothetical protein [Helicobacter fennelliae]